MPEGVLGKSGYLAAVILFVLFAARALFPNTFGPALDQTGLFLVALAFLALVVRWDRLVSFKAAGVELSLTEQPAVQQALATLTPRDGIAVDHERVRHALHQVEALLPGLVRGRVLWVDDKPEQLTGERRVLRSLGIEVLSCRSSREALRLLADDNDVNLVITDIQRAEPPLDNDKGPIIRNAGVPFVASGLRTHTDPAVKSLPVIFYSAYERKQAWELIKPALALPPAPVLCSTPQDLVTKVALTLFESRAVSIDAPDTKTPTFLKGHDDRTIQDEWEAEMEAELAANQDRPSR